MTSHQGLFDHIEDLLGIKIGVGEWSLLLGHTGETGFLLKSVVGRLLDVKTMPTTGIVLPSFTPDSMKVKKIA